ncbi:MAG: aldolase/citrate lyase family protein [Chloroflexi bacterium]|nr:aldolase/citrate lyase family protein [Chloroflexota bacterium]
MDQPNRVLTAMREGRKAYGFQLTFPAPQIIDIMGMLDLDYVWLDCEHGPFSLQDVENACRAAEAVGMTPIGRVPSTQSHVVLQYLDRGLKGVMGPHIATRADAEQLVRACKFGPEGERSYGANRGTGYNVMPPGPEGWGDRREFYRNANDNMLVGALLEDAQVIDDLDEILKVDGIDYFGVGHHDFGQSIGKPGMGDSPEVQAEQKKIYDRIRAAGGRIGDDFLIANWVHEMLLDGGRKIVEGRA